MILDQNVEQRFHNINSDPVSTHWNLVSTHTHAIRLTQNETRNINFQFGTPIIRWFIYSNQENIFHTGTRRFGSVYLGVLVLRVSEHAR